MIINPATTLPPMKKLLLIALLVVGRDNSRESTDCACVVGLAIS